MIWEVQKLNPETWIRLLYIFSNPIVMWVHFKLKTCELLTSEGELHLPVRSPRQVGDPPQTHTDGHDAAAVWHTCAPVHIMSPCSSVLLFQLRRHTASFVQTVWCQVPASVRAGPVSCLRRQIELLNKFPSPHAEARSSIGASKRLNFEQTFTLKDQIHHEIVNRWIQFPFFNMTCFHQLLIAY